MSKKSICLSFHVHQPDRLRQYRFFDIGMDSHYYDDFANRTSLRKVMQKCYIPANEILLKFLKEGKGAFKVSFAISGSLLEQFERYAPEMIDSFRELNATGCVEFIGCTYYESLASLASRPEFTHQVLKHRAKIKELFGVEPKSFLNTELVYSDAIGAEVADMGFESFIAEGAKNVLGWRNCDYVYTSAVNPKLKLLLREGFLSEDLSRRFSDRTWDVWPLTADTYCGWLDKAEGDVVNLAMDYETFGINHDASTGVFEFLSAFLEKSLRTGMSFLTPSEVVSKYRSVGELEVENATSWYGNAKDMSAWLGNELQQDAFNKLYGLSEKLAILADPVLWADFGHLQDGCNFYYMNTELFSNGQGPFRKSPYATPYEAFINYMNILSDFIIRVNNQLAEK